MSTQTVTLTGGAQGQPIISERLAAAAGILPGHLVAEALGKVEVHGTAATNAQKLFAQKNIATAGDLDQAYVDGETVSYGAYHSGQSVSALVAANATAILDGAALESAGDGTLRTVSADAATDQTQRDSIVAYAQVALDNSANAAVARISVRIA